MPTFAPEMSLPPTEDMIMAANKRFEARRYDKAELLNTAVGVIVDTNGNPFMPEVVGSALVEATQQAVGEGRVGYQSTRGHKDFLDAVVTDNDLGDPASVVGVQTSGGTGALFVAAHALPQIFERGGNYLFYDKGWQNHERIFSGWYTHAKEARRLTDQGVYDHDHYVNLVGERAGNNDVILVQGSGYNGDGIDRNTQQWSGVANIVVGSGAIPLIDSAYSRLVTLDDPKRDFGPLRELIERGVPSFLAYSTSKNMGMYGQRLGALLGFNIPEEHRPTVQQTLENVVRATNSNQPLIPALAIAKVLADPEKRALLHQWQDEQRHRIDENRKIFAETLGDDYAHRVAAGRGIFTTLAPDGLTEAQHLEIEARGLIALPNGRVNLGGFANSEQAIRAAEIFAVALQS